MAIEREWLDGCHNRGVAVRNGIQGQSLDRTALGAPAAQAQYTQKEWPEGPSKARFVATCDGCHDINRVRVGYTAEGWLTVVQMMQNAHAPVPAEEWGVMTDYLIRNFPERSRPVAVVIDGPVKADIRMWDVPTQGSRPHDPLAARDGSIWWTGAIKLMASQHEISGG